jgi:hypothetical protein
MTEIIFFFPKCQTPIHAVHRDKSGRVIDPKMEKLKKREEERKKQEKDSEHLKWGRGCALIYFFPYPNAIFTAQMSFLHCFLPQSLCSFLFLFLFLFTLSFSFSFSFSFSLSHFLFLFLLLSEFLFFRKSLSVIRFAYLDPLSPQCNSSGDAGGANS